MLQQKSTLKIGDRVQYIGDYDRMFGKFGVVEERNKTSRWFEKQTTETYIPVRFDGGARYSAYRRNLIKAKPQTPVWEV